MTSDKGAQIIEKARELGASMAGIASVDLLKRSPSHKVLAKLGFDIDGIGSRRGATDLDGVRWPAKAKSAFVFAVSHPQDKPELDWWKGGSPGNHILVSIGTQLSEWIEETFDINTYPVPYSVDMGGIYLKDTAVLAGLGCIGKNNLLVTPELGPRVRLRAMFLGEALAPTGPIAFDPCNGCEELCRQACPQSAYERVVLSSTETGTEALPGRDGCFSRSRCMIQMSEDAADAGSEYRGFEAIDDIPPTEEPGKYCRQCEFACPVGS